MQVFRSLLGTLNTNTYPDIFINIKNVKIKGCIVRDNEAT
jgi:hypothetical protein